MLRKLKIKFVCINMLIVTIMLGAIFGLLFHVTRWNLHCESVEVMHAILERPLQSGQIGLTADGLQPPYFALQVGPGGELLAVGGNYYELSDEEFLYRMLETSAALEEETGVLEEYQLRFLRSVTPTEQMVVFVDTSRENSVLKSLTRNCIWIGAASFLIFFVVSILLANWAVKPVEEAWKRQRQFVADASHELKTPLTVILSGAELLQSAEYDETTKQRSSQNMLAAARQMRGLTEQLLEMARVDSGQPKDIMKPVDFGRLAEDVLLLFEPLYFERGLLLKDEMEPEIIVQGQEAGLRQVVEILLDNGLKYSSGGKMVTVCLKRYRRRFCLFTVATPGEEIPKQELKHIFERFYRLDNARNGKGSYGLGLSIAREIVRTHKGKIWAESSGGENRFYVRLPVKKGALIKS